MLLLRKTPGGISIPADLLLKGGTIIKGNERVCADVAITGEKIASVGRPVQAKKTLDCTGMLLLPGLIDAHVHFRTPGHTHKEDWKHGSKAALYGGVTTVLDMPNNAPSTTTPERLEKKREIVAKEAGVDYGFFYGASAQHLDTLAKVKNVPGIKLYYGETTGDLVMDDHTDVARLFESAAKLNFLVAVHAEDNPLIKEHEKQARRESWPAAVLHARIRSSEVEAKALRDLLALQQGTDVQMHVCHLSSAAGLEVFAQSQAPNLTCETTPHHLYFTDHDVADLGYRLKVNPAISGSGNREALWEGLSSGVIQGVASDHAPHTLKEKAADYWHAPSGLPGVQTLLPVMLDGAARNAITLSRIQDACCHFPALRFGIQGKGFLEKGYDADVAAVAPEAEQVIKSEQMQSLCGWTPWEGRLLRGKVVHTFLRGVHAIENGALKETPRGKEAVFIHNGGV